MLLLYPSPKCGTNEHTVTHVWTRSHIPKTPSNLGRYREEDHHYSSGISQAKTSTHLHPPQNCFQAATSKDSGVAGIVAAPILQDNNNNSNSAVHGVLLDVFSAEEGSLTASASSSTNNNNSYVPNNPDGLVLDTSLWKTADATVAAVVEASNVILDVGNSEDTGQGNSSGNACDFAQLQNVDPNQGPSFSYDLPATESEVVDDTLGGSFDFLGSSSDLLNAVPPVAVLGQEEHDQQHPLVGLLKKVLLSVPSLYSQNAIFLQSLDDDSSYLPTSALNFPLRTEEGQQSLDGQSQEATSSAHQNATAAPPPPQPVSVESSALVTSSSEQDPSAPPDQQQQHQQQGEQQQQQQQGYLDVEAVSSSDGREALLTFSAPAGDLTFSDPFCGILVESR